MGLGENKGVISRKKSSKRQPPARRTTIACRRSAGPTAYDNGRVTSRNQACSSSSSSTGRRSAGPTAYGNSRVTSRNQACSSSSSSTSRRSAGHQPMATAVWPRAAKPVRRHRAAPVDVRLANGLWQRPCDFAQSSLFVVIDHRLSTFGWPSAYDNGRVASRSQARSSASSSGERRS